MPNPANEEITLLLQQAARGDKEAAERLLAAVYPTLKQMATQRLQRERRDHTLQATELVHEVFLRLFGGAPIAWQNRAHFFAVVARQMRNFLVDYARKNHLRRGAHITLASECEELVVNISEDLVALDEALEQLQERDPRAARVVELRFFGGLTEKEAAAVLEVSLNTVKRDWELARAWLFDRLSGQPALRS